MRRVVARAGPDALESSDLLALLLYGQGSAEHRVGTALRRRPPGSFVMSTKVGRLLTPAPGGRTKTTRYVGRAESDQARLQDYVTRIYQRRNFTPEQVADEILAAIASDAPVAVVTPEAKIMHALSRFAPGALRRLAGIDALPV